VRAWLGWIAAVLLIALAFTGGPDAIDTSPPAAQTTIASGELAEKREAQVRDDDADVVHQITDSVAPRRLRMLALPPSSQTAAPIPVRGATLAVPSAAPPTIAEGGRRPHLGACTPETLQIFRC
jgi:hypothetical protein